MSEYEEHRRREETAYLLEYEAWEATLSDGDRAVLGKAAVPDLDASARSPVGLTSDVAEHSNASTWPDPAEAIEENQTDLLREKFSLTLEQAKGVAVWLDEQVDRQTAETQGTFLVRIVSELLSTSNVRLSAAGLAFASGLAPLTGCGSLREWSREHGHTPAALSKSAGHWRRELGLPENEFSKNEEAREKYRRLQLKDHWRRR